MGEATRPTNKIKKGNKMDKKKIKNVLKNTYTNTMDYLDKQGTKFEQSTLFTFKANDPSNKQKRVSPFSGLSLNKDFFKKPYGRK